MPARPSPRSARPRTKATRPERVARKILERIESGAPRSGVLPSQRALAQEFGVSRSTVSQALQILEAGGFVATPDRRRARVAEADTPLSKKLAAFLSESGFSAPPAHHAQVRLDAPNDLQAGAIDLAALCDEHWDGQINAEIEEAAALRALRKYRAGETSIYGSIGIERLREFVVRYLERAGVRAKASEIAVIPRRLYAIRLVLEVLTGKGCELWAPALSNARFYGVGDRFPAKLCALPVSAEGEIDFSPLWFSKKPRIALLEPDRARPTGASIPAADRARLVREAARRNVFLFDDSYCRLLYEEKAPPLAACDPGKESVIYLGAVPTWLSPLASFCFIHAHERIVKLLRAAIRRDYLNPEFLPQLCAIELEESGDIGRMLERFHAYHRERLLRVDRSLAAAFGTEARWRLPGSFGCVWLELPGTDIGRLYQARRDVDFQPGWLYGEPERECRHVMLRYTLPEDRFEEGLRRFRALWESVRGG